MLVQNKNWFVDVFWVDGVDVCFVYSLGFIHMVWSCFLVMPVCEKKLLLDVFWVDGVNVWFVYGHGFVHIVYVPKLDTANHLGELS